MTDTFYTWLLRHVQHTHRGWHIHMVKEWQWTGRLSRNSLRIRRGQTVSNRWESHHHLRQCSLRAERTLPTALSGHWFSLLKPTGYVMHQQFNIQQLYALPTMYLCFVFIWEQTATCATYSINWLVFITEMKSVYCAVWTGSLNKAVCASSLKGYLRTNSDLCHLQHKLIGFYNWDEKCLQRGTDWVFK